MDSFFKMVDVQTVLFIYMAVGFGCRKAGIFNDVARDKLTDFVVFVTLPCMIFESFNMAFSLESLKQGALALLIAVGMSGVALLRGKVLYNRFPYEEKSILQYGTLVSNSGFAGLPVVSGAYGDEGLFLGSLFIIPTRILMWSAGISLFTRDDACSTPASSPWRWAWCGCSFRSPCPTSWIRRWTIWGAAPPPWPWPWWGPSWWMCP